MISGLMEKLKSISRQDILIYITIIYSILLVIFGILFNYTDGLVLIDYIHAEEIMYAHDLQSSGANSDMIITLSAILFGAALLIAIINLISNKFMKKEFLFSFYFFVVVWLIQLLMLYSVNLDIPITDTIKHGNIIFIMWLVILAISGPALIINRVILKKI